MTGYGTKRRKTMSALMSAFGLSSRLVVLNLSLVDHGKHALDAAPVMRDLSAGLHYVSRMT
jgi:hypothetical protein